MKSEQAIIDRINNRLTMNANKLEGGFSQDIIQSVAYELANIQDVELDNLANRCFVATAEDEDLDNVGNDYGIARRESAPAIVMLEITGEVGAVINQNVKAAYNNLVYNVQEYKKINSSGVVTVRAKCDTLGTIGNVPASSITQFATAYEGLRTVTNPEPAYDGFDREPDEIYRQRIMDYLAMDVTNANKAQYRKWATDVTGVQKAIVKGAEEMGAGNVGVFIAAIEATVSQDLIYSVKTYIESVQPINATVIVESLDYLNININATLALTSGYDTADVKDEFIEKLKVYLPTVTTSVSYLRISDLLFACSGVEDVVDYTLNGVKDSIKITDRQYPVVGEVTINAD